MTEIKINKKMVYLSDHLAVLAENHRGRTMKKQLEVKIVWHPYPEEPLPETEFDRTYLVTAVGAYVKPHVRTEFGSREHGFEIYPKDVEVIAWAELPEPYKEGKES